MYHTLLVEKIIFESQSPFKNLTFEEPEVENGQGLIVNCIHSAIVCVLEIKFYIHMLNNVCIHVDVAKQAKGFYHMM